MTQQAREGKKMAVDAAAGTTATPPAWVAHDSPSKTTPKSPFRFGEDVTVPVPPPETKQTPEATIDQATDAELRASYTSAYQAFVDYKEAAEGLPARLTAINDDSKAKPSEKAAQKEDATDHVVILMGIAGRDGDRNLDYQQRIADLRAIRAEHAKKDPEKDRQAMAEWKFSLKLVGDSRELNDAIKAY
jgi:hypothetical protein